MSEHLDVVASGGGTVPSVAVASVAGATPSLDAKLAGVFAPICTPFARDESVDDEALRSNLARYAGSGLLGYLALGSNGENRSLSEEERLVVLDTIVRHKGEGQVVMAGATYDAQRDT